MAQGQDAIESERADARRITRSAIAGAGSLTARSAAVGGFGLLANVVLARFLAPREFGLVAIGNSALVVGTYLASGGLGSALIGRQRPPTRMELEAVLGLQLAVTCGLAGGAGALAVALGRPVAVPALMLAALPLAALRAPAAIVLERELSFGRIATVDLVEAVAQCAWAVAAVLAGFGVWGLVSAAVVRIAAGTVAMLKLARGGPLRPRWSWRSVRPLLGFGVRFQAISLVGVVRDQVLAVGIASIGGLGLLGLWSLAWRIMQLPLQGLASLYRVSYPAMARLIELGEDPRALLEQGIVLVSLATGALAAAIAAAAPSLVPAVFGARWAPAGEILRWAALAIALSGPISAVTVGYLLANGDTRSTLRAGIAHSAAWVVAALALLPLLGPAGLGLGWVAGAIVDVIVLRHSVAASSSARVLSRAAPAVALGALAAVLGWLVSLAVARGAARGVSAAMVAELALIVGVTLTQRELAGEALRRLRRIPRASNRAA